MSTDTEGIDNTSELDKLKAKLAEFEAGKDEPGSKNIELRLKKAQDNNAELKDTLVGLNQTIADMQAADKARELKNAESNGDFKSIVQMKDSEIETLKAQLESSQLDKTRLMIGRRNNLPDSVSILLPGSDADQIEANAIKLRADIKPSGGFSDARQSGGVVVTGNGQKKPRTNYTPVRPEGAF